jgi:hypothetical protein
MENTINWLLEGDPSIIYQTKRDLLDIAPQELVNLRKTISKKGWGKEFLSRRNSETGLWGNGIYSPKWISATYTLLDLKNLCIGPDERAFAESIGMIVDCLWKKPQKAKDRYLDLCVCGMLLNLSCYAKNESAKINEIVDFVLQKQFHDGAWNCRWEFDTNHSSLHTTINILEGINEYIQNGYSYKRRQLLEATKKAHEFILMHHLFMSDKTMKVIDEKMTMLSFPARWRYDILRGMDYFWAINHRFDERMLEAIRIINGKKLSNNRWPVQHKHAGKVHFDMEKQGKESRWNTLRALRVLKRYCLNCPSFGSGSAELGKK